MPDTFQEIKGCVAVRIKGVYKVNKGQGYNIVHLMTPLEYPTFAEVQACNSVVDDWVENHYRLHFSNDWKVIAIEAFSAAIQAGPAFDLAVSYTGAMNSSDEAAHAPLVLLDGGTTARVDNGKLYAFSPAASEVTDEGYSPTLMNNLVQALTALKVSASNAGYPLAVGSRKSRRGWAVSSVTFSERLTFQKRRRAGFGR